jgi:hypothetical protein
LVLVKSLHQKATIADRCLQLNCWTVLFPLTGSGMSSTPSDMSHSLTSATLYTNQAGALQLDYPGVCIEETCRYAVHSLFRALS